MGAARLAEYFSIPMATGVGDLVVRNKDNDDMYETLTILSYNIGKLSSEFIIFLSFCCYCCLPVVVRTITSTHMIKLRYYLQ